MCNIRHGSFETLLFGASRVDAASLHPIGLGRRHGVWVGAEQSGGGSKALRFAGGDRQVGTVLYATGKVPGRFARQTSAAFAFRGEETESWPHSGDLEAGSDRRSGASRE